MASFTMTTATLLGVAGVGGLPRVPTSRRLVVRAVSGSGQGDNAQVSCETRDSNGRRNVVLAAAAAAVCSVAGIAAAEEPKPGSLEAKKIYAPVCVTMPTARICRK